MLIYFSSTFLVPGGDLFLSDEWRHGEGLRQYRHVPARTEALRCKEAKPRCGARGVEKVSKLSRVTPAPFFSTPLLFQLVRRLPAREITELDKQPTPPLPSARPPGREEEEKLARHLFRLLQFGTYVYPWEVEGWTGR
jgi:hypothetical protein